MLTALDKIESIDTIMYNIKTENYPVKKKILEAQVSVCVSVCVCTHSTVLLHAGGSLSVMNTQLISIVAMINKLNKVLFLRKKRIFSGSTMSLIKDKIERNSFSQDKSGTLLRI